MHITTYKMAQGSQIKVTWASLILELTNLNRDWGEERNICSLVFIQALESRLCISPQNVFYLHY